MPAIDDDYVNTLMADGMAKAEKAFDDGNLVYAEALFKQLIRVGASTNDCAHILALTLHRQGKNDEAKDVLSDWLAGNDPGWEICNTYGIICSATNKSEEAIEYFKMALERNRLAAIPRSNLALELYTVGRFDKAVELLEEAIELCEDEEKGLLYYNLGNLYGDELNLEKAEEYYRTAFDINPYLENAEWNLSTCLLKAGKYEEGWSLYEGRWSQLPQQLNKDRKYPTRPEWYGEDLNGRTVLLYCEQGAGDMIQFIRFAKHLKERGAIIFLEWPANSNRGNMITLLANVKWIDRVIDPAEERLVDDFDFDYHFSVSSLPMALEINSDDEIRIDPYIEPDGDFCPLLEEHRWMPYKDKFKIGIVWAGSAGHKKDNDRSFSINEFQHLSNQKNVQLFSLQKDKRYRAWRGEKIDLCDGLDDMPIVDFGPMLIDFTTTANVISKLDLVVTVDTAIAHIAGAMDKPTFVILPYVCDWRWGTKDTTPWYDSVKLFRQTIKGSWKEPMAKIVEEIKKLIVLYSNPC